ncbi:MAG: hypothetical protein HY070_08430, partial [Chloroflexi bacterium]|nr:hypothetical protein [Chloroflexota bacterium]
MNTKNILLLVALCASALVLAGQLVITPAQARFSSTSNLDGNTFVTTNLVAPSSLTASVSGHDVALSWSAGQNGTAYAVKGVANGTSSDCSSATFASIASTASTSYTDSNRFSPQGNYFCYQVQTTLGTWNSTTSNPTVAAQIGFFATSAQFTNGGTSGALDTGDQIVVNFNQAVNTATAPSGTDTVCPAYQGILLGSATTSGVCDTAVYRVGSFTKSTGSAPVSQSIAH